MIIHPDIINMSIDPYVGIGIFVLLALSVFVKMPKTALFFIDPMTAIALGTLLATGYKAYKSGKASDASAQASKFSMMGPETSSSGPVATHLAGDSGNQGLAALAQALAGRGENVTPVQNKGVSVGAGTGPAPQAGGQLDPETLKKLQQMLGGGM